MARTQWAASSAATPVIPRVQWATAGATGSVPSQPRVQWASSGASGPVAVIIAPIATQKRGPGQRVTITAAPNLTPDSYIWRQLSGPNVTTTGTGGSRTFTAPSVFLDGATVVFGITPVLGGASGPEVTARVDVFPQTISSRAPGGQWVGAVVGGD